ncbi:MAG: hypothetical protein LQ343_001191 [Gyalolechia ehrenbergii]|nr:MAG: hypothetical protein LQ343_001191 [Gyalolechia ehrenbergii]
MQPPSGGSHSTGPGMLVITWLFTGISAVVVSLKIWTRYKIIGQTGLEDVFTVLALAKSLLIPKGYHHSHSRRHRPPPLVPRDSGSGATAGTATRNRSGPDEDVESGTAMQQEKRQEFAEATTPSTAKTDKSMEKEAEEAMSHV